MAVKVVHVVLFNAPLGSKVSCGCSSSSTSSSSQLRVCVQDSWSSVCILLNSLPPNCVWCCQLERLLKRMAEGAISAPLRAG